MVNPEMIVLARESRGWTQRELASQLGIRQTTLSKYELGALSYPERDLTQLSKITNFDPEFFRQSGFQKVGLAGDFLYRKRAHVTAKVRRRVQAEVNIRRIQLYQLTRRADVERDEFPFPSIQPEEMEGRIDKIAIAVREAWRLPSGPIRNLTAAIENAGGIVFAIDFESDLIDGTNVRLPGEPPMLFVNSRATGDRHRFNLAHELAHVIMHFGLVFDNAEMQANQFAAEFLMPRRIIRSDLRNLDLADAARLKLVWGVSMAAIIKRAYDLGVISQSKYRRMFTMLNARGMRTNEPIEVPFEQPAVFNELLRVHREEFGMDDSEIRKILFTDSLGVIAPANRDPIQLRLAW